MDSLDTWLNRQRGWRRLALTWLVSLPFGVCLGTMWVSLSNWDEDWNGAGPTALGAAAASVHLALGVAASVPLAILAFAIEALSRRRPAKPGKIRPPRFLWRAIVSLNLLVTNGAYQVWSAAQPRQWHHNQHDFAYVFVVQLGLIALSMALMIWNLLYWSRLKRQAAVATASELRWPLGRCRPGSIEPLLVGLVAFPA